MNTLRLLYIDFKTVLRRKEVIFWNIIFPPLLLLLSGWFTLNSTLMEGTYMDFLTPGLIGYSIMQGSLTGAPLRIVQYSQSGFLTRIYLTPYKINRFIFLEFTVASILLFLQSIFMIFISKLFFGVTVKSWSSLLLGIILAIFIFQMLGTIIATIARTSEGADAIANCLSFPMLIFSGVFFPTYMLPISKALSPLLPLTQIINIMRAEFNPDFQSIVVIVGWIGVIIIIKLILKNMQRH